MPSSVACRAAVSFILILPLIDWVSPSDIEKLEPTYFYTPSFKYFLGPPISVLHLSRSPRYSTISPSEMRIQPRVLEKRAGSRVLGNLHRGSRNPTLVRKGRER